MNIITNKYLDSYKGKLPLNIQASLAQLDKIELTPQTFTFYTSVAVISSSRIEGEQMEIDSYVKHKMQDIEYLPELVEKPNDLYKAYLYANKHKLTADNFLQCHTLLSQHLLPEYEDMYRENEMLVMEHNTGRIQYEAAPFAIVENEMEKLWKDIDSLLNTQLGIEEIFYYASFIHMAFVNIHPFNDGNGKAARLLEKWFLAMHLGEKAWYIKSEKYYYLHVDAYYKNLNHLGMFYDKIDYAQADLFLQMLPAAMTFE